MGKTEKKKWYQSKTLIINALGIVGAVVLGAKDIIESGGIITIACLINIVLRYFTNQGVK